MFSNYFYLGKVTKHFGLAGELNVYIDSDEPSKYYHMESVFFNLGEELIPFFVESIKVKSPNQLVIKFADITGENVEEYVGVELYQPMSMLPPLTGNKFYYHEVIGFKVEDVNLGYIGIIDDILDYPAQAIIKISYEEKEILLPVVDEYIVNVDREARVMTVRTPEGLVNMYMNME